jgi:hypothetical protein
VPVAGVVPVAGDAESHVPLGEAVALKVSAEPPPLTLIACGAGALSPARKLNESVVGVALIVGAAVTVSETGTFTVVPPVGTMAMLPVYVPAESPAGLTVTVSGLYGVVNVPDPALVESQVPPVLVAWTVKETPEAPDALTIESVPVRLPEPACALNDIPGCVAPQLVTQATVTLFPVPLPEPTTYVTLTVWVAPLALNVRVAVLVEFAASPLGLTETDRFAVVFVDVGETVSQEALEVTVNGVVTLAETESTWEFGVTPFAELKERLVGLKDSVPPPPPLPPPFTTSTTGKDTGLLAAVDSLMLTDDV